MNTSKPISTISYNSEYFLQDKLNELVRNGMLSEWYYIKHSPESDEKKAHIHLYVAPNKRLDTNALGDFFRELDPMHPDKPLGCINWQSSKIDDWLLYVMHYEPYLRSKLEQREYHYAPEDFVSYNEDSFDEAYRHALRASDWSKTQRAVMALSSGVSASELLSIGAVSMNQACQLLATEKLLDRRCYRNDRKGHEEDLDKYDDIWLDNPFLDVKGDKQYDK